MNLTLRFSNARSRQNSLSENGSGAATDQAPLQSFQRRLFQQNQGVADIIAVGPGIGRKNFLDAHRQASRPAPGFGGILELSALFHSGMPI
ncbi:MAG: hypothetical protein ABSF60_12705 [Verrucomicrobiota bacterium]|jgi:hypothetical protein